MKFVRTSIAVILGVHVAGCGSLTSVDAPDVRQPGDFQTAAGASALAAGAMTLFTLAFGGTPAGNSIGDNQVANSGDMADELFLTSTTTGQIDWDSRTPTDPPARIGPVYDRIQAARINLVTAISNFEQAAPDSGARIGQLFALTAFTEVFLGESFCSGVPLSALDANFSPVYGQPLTTTQIYERAVSDFDSALAHTDSARIQNLARIGKGRALLDLALYAEAAQAVAGVPTTYVYSVNFVAGTNTGNNGVFANGANVFQNVPEREGINGMNWRSANDPRVPLVNRSPALRGQDGTDRYDFALYNSTTAPIVLASGKEARLIEAEAALQAGNFGSWLAIHNALRATVPGLAPLSDPGGTAARVDLHFRERALWLFLTGHRHGDLRRLVRQYNRDAETVFPTGAWRQGLNYGTATNMALPAQQRNNPNYSGCLNRDA